MGCQPGTKALSTVREYYWLWVLVEYVFFVFQEKRRIDIRISSLRIEENSPYYNEKRKK